MADAPSVTLADAMLDNEAADYVWVQMHVGAPGSAGTGNQATNTTRKQVTWAAASAGVLASSSDASWTSVPATETYTHFTAWSLASGGVFGFSGSVTNGAVTSGQDAKIPSGSLTYTITTAS